MPVLALLDSVSEINAIYRTFAWELRLFIRPTDVETQKIDSTMPNTFKIVVTAFSMTNKANQIRFFEKPFLMANISPEVVFAMFFLILNSTDIDFLGLMLC